MRNTSCYSLLSSSVSCYEVTANRLIRYLYRRGRRRTIYLSSLICLRARNFLLLENVFLCSNANKKVPVDFETLLQRSIKDKIRRNFIYSLSLEEIIFLSRMYSAFKKQCNRERIK